MTRASEGKVNCLPSCGVDDCGEVGRVEAGTADQGAVDVGLPEQLGGVVRLDRAAVEDPHLIGGSAALAQRVADEGAYLLRLLGSCGAAGADRPDRLIGDHQL